MRFPVLGRRAVLAGMAATALTCPPAGPSGTRPARAAMGGSHVAVIGAGMAGLAAARTLLDADVRVTVLEARDRVGGRALTENATFGVPYDHGASWLHSADANPLTSIATGLGFAVEEQYGVSWLYQDARNVTAPAEQLLGRGLSRLLTALEVAGEAGRDVAIGSLFPAPEGWDRMAAAIVGALDAGEELDRMSSLDHWRQIDTGDERVVPQGLGAVVAKFGAGIPVELQTPVSSVRWDGAGVRLETPRGTVEADAVIVTVPTGVLAAGGMRFTPDLPIALNQAIADLPMGVLNKLTLSFPPGVLACPPMTELAQLRADGRLGDAVLRPYGTELAIGFVGGDLARSLEKEGEKAALAHARAIIADVFGSSAASKVMASHATAWGVDPWSGGSCSIARPGRADARYAADQLVGDRIAFAGEAWIDDWATQLPGAYFTGIRAAEKVLKALAGR